MQGQKKYHIIKGFVVFFAAKYSEVAQGYQDSARNEFLAGAPIGHNFKQQDLTCLR